MIYSCNSNYFAIYQIAYYSLLSLRDVLLRNALFNHFSKMSEYYKKHYFIHYYNNNYPSLYQTTV